LEEAFPFRAHGSKKGASRNASSHPGYATIRLRNVLIRATVRVWPNLQTIKEEIEHLSAAERRELADWFAELLRNVQNRLGYIVHLAKEVVRSRTKDSREMQILSEWERDLEDARLAREDTLCRDSMPQRERFWLRAHRPPAAEHWNLLTSLTAEQLPYAGK